MGQGAGAGQGSKGHGDPTGTFGYWGPHETDKAEK
jgi:hypothetical protein